LLLHYTYKGEPFTGVGFDDVPGYGISEITYVDGRQEGPSRDWYPSGRLKAETMYKSNARHGHNREFREDGTLVLEEIYEHSVLVRSTVFDSAGNVLEQFEISEDSPNYEYLQRLRAPVWIGSCLNWTETVCGLDGLRWSLRQWRRRKESSVN
jgi:antitoxin component YwqK of YwqJK toxin-antitoxin module